jgi:hypothetical protein
VASAEKHVQMTKQQSNRGHNMKKVVTLLVFVVLLTYVQLQGGQYWVMNTMDDGSDGTLRWAIEQANTHAGYDIIRFNLVEGDPPYVFRPVSPLPALTDPSGVFFQGMNPNPNLSVEISGEFTSDASGLVIRSSNNRISQIAIKNFDQHAILIDADPHADSNRIDGCYIGTDYTGETLYGNDGCGIKIVNEDGETAIHNLIEECLISGSGQEGIYIIGTRSALADNFGHVITENKIGTNLSGTTDFGNGRSGVRLYRETHHDTISFNVISGNDFDGVSIHGQYFAGDESYCDSNVVLQNYIGCTAVLEPLPNSMHGVAVGLQGSGQTGYSRGNQIVQENYIAYNGMDGISIAEYLWPLVRFYLCVESVCWPDCDFHFLSPLFLYSLTISRIQEPVKPQSPQKIYRTYANFPEFLF